MTISAIYARLCKLVGRWTDKEISEEFYNELLDEMDLIARAAKDEVDSIKDQEEFKNKSIMTFCYALEHLKSLSDKQFSAIEELVKMERQSRGLARWLS